MIKKTVQFLLFVGIFLLGAWLSWRYFAPRNRAIEDSSVLLEKIQAVAKLSTVEGQFSEIYNYSEYQGFFTYLWDKKVLVRVKATVSAGYNLEDLHIETDAVTKTIYMSAFPEPQILSIDHTIDYYDISEGVFQSFSAEDYNRINQRAKDIIREQAMKSNLLDEARIQASKMLDLLRFMIEGAGWRLEVGKEGVRESLQ
jgi:hypothetical protein